MTVARLVFPALLASVAVLPGCGDGSDGDGNDGDGDGDGNIMLADDNNYSSSSVLNLPVIETAAGTDVEICWSDVTDDIQCHDVDPMDDLDNVSMTRFRNLSEEDVEGLLATTQLSQSQTDGYLEWNTTHDTTCTDLSSLSFFGTEVEIEEEYVESDEHVYMVVVTEGTTPGVGARTMAFIKPSSDSTTTSVELPTGCGILDFSADIASADPVAVPTDGPWVLDWREITEDSTGNAVAFESIDSVLVAFYGGMTVSDVEEQILDIEIIATALYEVELDGGRTADLSDARERESKDAFPGFDTDEDGVWLLALMCGSCQNPAPILLTVLELSE